MKGILIYTKYIYDKCITHLYDKQFKLDYSFINTC